MRPSTSFLAIAILAGCSAAADPGDDASTIDAGSADSSATDARSEGDTGTSADAGALLDTGAADAATTDAGPLCMPMGTYDIVWTHAATNSPDCPDPTDSAEIGADGIDVLFDDCPVDCGESCSRQAATRGSCTAETMTLGPCLGLSKGRMITTSTSFDDGSATFALSDASAAGDACSYTGVGTRR